MAGPVLRGVCDATTLWSVCPRRQWSVGIAIKALKGKGQSQLFQANQGKIALNCMHFQLHLLKVNLLWSDPCRNQTNAAVTAAIFTF